MKSAASGFLQHPEAEREWVARHELREADRAFRRAGRRRLARRSVSFLFRCRAESGRGLSGELVVPLDCVAGILGQGGGPLSPLLRGSLLPAWRRAFLADEVEGYAPLPARRTAGGWYLTGGMSAWLRLEILKAKGHRCLRIREQAVQSAGAGCRQAAQQCACQPG